MDLRSRAEGVLRLAMALPGQSKTSDPVEPISIKKGDVLLVIDRTLMTHFLPANLMKLLLFIWDKYNQWPLSI